jgi:hypothetical protein
VSEQAIIDALDAASHRHREWAALAGWLANPNVGVHLAVMLEPYLSFILSGQKTIESRFAKNAIAPYRRVAVGDLVLLKAGPVVGSFSASSVNCLALGQGDLAELRRDHALAICAEDDEFWQARADKRYATLIGISDVRKLPAVAVPKRDMRGWVVLRAPAASLGERPGLW